jgi:hypothetical protein
VPRLNWGNARYLIAAPDPAARKQIYDGLVQSPQNLKYANGLEVRPSPPPPTRLSQIRVPTLLLDGDADIPDVFLYSGQSWPTCDWRDTRSGRTRDT